MHRPTPAEVVATDISARALRLAATTAELSGYRWDLRAGSLLEPVADEAFDLIVANPPFVVSPGLDREHGGYDYRDSGLAGDAASATPHPRHPAPVGAGRQRIAAGQLDRPHRRRLGRAGRGLARRRAV